jgi:hypothetical protein
VSVVILTNCERRYHGQREFMRETGRIRPFCIQVGSTREFLRWYLDWAIPERDLVDLFSARLTGSSS